MDGPVRAQAGTKRVRVLFGGRVIADTVRPVLVWEVPYFPMYYVPMADVLADALVPTGRVTHAPGRGDGRLATVRVGDREAVDAALTYADPQVDLLRDTVRFDWGAMDAWFEEDEQVYTHPRDPQVRVDILASSRVVRVEVDGVTVAESPRPHLLFETGLPTRYYLPRTDVRLDLLDHSDTVTHCPYKGSAEYWSVRAGDRVHRDLAWSYPAPFPESQKVAGLIAFLDERVTVFVDGVRQDRPRTHFSDPA